MPFHGSITFDIADEKDIDVDFGVDIIPTKTVKKSDVVFRGRSAPKNRWMYKLEFDNEEVSIKIFIGSNFAQIGFYLPNHILKKIALLDCEVSIEIISFGMVEDEDRRLADIKGIL